MSTDSPNPYETPATAANECRADADRAGVSDDDAFGRRKTRQLIAMAVLFFVSGCLAGVWIDDPASTRAVDLVTAIGFAVLVLRWCMLDTAERGARPWRLFVFLVVICPGPFVMIPVYLCSTRGWRRGLLSTALAAAFLLLLLLLAMLGGIAGLVLSGGWDG